MSNTIQDTDKPTQQTSFTKIELKSSVKLFEQTSIFKSLMRVVFLSVIVSLVSGLYIFADQVLMTKILPLNQEFVDDTLKKIGWFSLESTDFSNPLINDFSTKTGAITSVIRVANSAISPITLICTALSLLIGMGTGIPYSKALGSKDSQKINEVWRHGFYNCLVISIVTSIIIMALSNLIVSVQISNIASDSVSPAIKIFLEKKREITIQYATNYSLIIVGFNILNCFFMLYVTLLNSEGKNSVPTIVAIIANGLNILLDFVLLRYTMTGISGSAIATIVSYCMSNIMFLGYMIKKIKDNDTFLLFKTLTLKKFKINWTVLGLILSIGISSFFRSTGTSIFSLTQQSIYSDITNVIDSTKESSYYIDILGAVNPIYNLFFSAIIGIIRGSRTVLSYNYGKNNQKNVLKSFWISNGLAVAYGVIFYIIVCPMLTTYDAAQGGFLWFFGITPDKAMYQDTVTILNITMAQLIIFALSVSGMLYFQSTAKPYSALLTSLMNGIIVGIPVLFILKAIALSTMNMNVFICAPLINTFIAGLFVFLYTIWTIYLKKQKIYFER